MLLSAMQKNPGLSSWAKWVRDDARRAAREIRDFLETCFVNIAQNKHKRLLQRIAVGDENEVDAALHELVAHELLRRLHFEPEFQPDLGTSLTPDMVVKITNQQFIVDVYLPHNPSRTIRPLPVRGLGVESESVYTVDRGERAKKICDAVLGKCRRYSPTGKPMILVVFLGDHFVDMDDVQSALYGASLEDAWLRDDFPHAITDFRQELVSKHIDPPPGGAMLPDDHGHPGCPRLSAVLACDWFDTLNRSRPGKRLHCLVVHHWDPDVPIPTGQFGEFAEIAWSSKAAGCYGWALTGSPRTVTRFEGADEFEFRDYDPSNPW